LNTYYPSTSGPTTLLAREQAAAIREILAWIASRQQSPDDESGDDNADT